MSYHGKDGLVRSLCPAFILEQHSAGETEGVIRAAALDIDLSGFTKITDELSAHGPRGAELLADIMRAVFEPLVKCVHEYGGFISHYAGDGFLALFPESETANAVAAGWLMRQTIRSRRRYRTPFGTFEFNASIAITFGDIRWRIFSSPSANRQVYYFDGPPIVEAAQVRQDAKAGELVVTPEVSSLLAAHIKLEKSEYGHIVSDVENLPAPSPVAQMTDIATQSVGHFFPKNMARSMNTGEFRQTVNLFVKVENPEEQFETFTQAVFSAQKQFGGYLNGITDGDKGCSAYFFWGAPTATENDIGRALEFVAQLQSDPTLNLRAGLTYGVCHSGYSGSASHAVYTCMGREVNLAARLMMAAKPGETLISDGVRNYALGMFKVDFTGDLQLKGIAQGQHIYALGERRVETARVQSAGPLVDREQDIDKLTHAVQTIFENGKPGVVLVLGGAGAGKTSVLTALAESLDGDPNGKPAEMRKIRLIADNFKDQSLGPFRRMVRQIFDISPGLKPAQRRDRFDQRLAELQPATGSEMIAQELKLARSFLAALVGIFWDGSPYAQVGPELRKRNTVRALTALVQAMAVETPLLMIADDLHTFDSDSRDVLDHLVQQPAPAIAVLASGRLDDISENQTPLFENTASSIRVTLGGLSADGVRKVASRALGALASSRIVAFLMEKTAGNPLYLEQLLLALAAQGAFIYRGDAADRRVELTPDAEAGLPPGISGILVARLDRLPANLKTVVQAAAILGYEFDANWLRAILEQDEKFHRLLQNGVDQKIWDQTGKDHYRFRHALLRDTVYDMQLVGFRRALHERAVRVIEAFPDTASLDRLGALAYHSERAELSEVAQKYLLLAGDMAHEQLEYHSAAHFYRRLLRYPLEEKLEVHVCNRLGTLLGMTGDWEEAEAVLDRALTGLRYHSDVGQQIEILTMLGDVLRKSGDYAKARERLELAQAMARRSGELVRMGHVLIVLAGCYKYSGDYERSQDIYSQALEIGNDIDDENIIAVSLAGLASTYGIMGQIHEAVDFNRRAIPILERINDRQQLIYPIGNLGIDLFTIGDYDAALQVLERSLAECNAIGDREGIWMAYHFMARAHHKCGNLQAAIPLYENAMQERGALGADGIPYDIRPHISAALAEAGQETRALADFLDQLVRLQRGELDREHGRVYLEVAKMMIRGTPNTSETEALLKKLAAIGPGRDPIEWLKRADESAVSGSSLGLPVRIGVLMAHAELIAQGSAGDHTAAAPLKAAQAIALKNSLGGELRSVLEMAQRVNVDLSAEDTAMPEYPLHVS